MNDESAWIVPYGNLMTILMIFFLLLYAYTYLTGQVRYEKVVASLTEGFGRSAPIKEVELAEYLENYFSTREEYLKNMDMASDRITLMFNLPVFFEKDSIEIKESALAVLDDIFRIMHDLPNEIVISGFAGLDSRRDKMPVAAGRALNIGQFFIKKGIDPQRLILKGWGEAPSGSEALEDRVEISIMREVSPPDIPVSEKLIKMKENYFYGDYYYKKGELKKAEIFFGYILDLDPSHWKARRMIKRIQRERALSKSPVTAG
ncbi:OmpA family protein [bacterium]|nr:OmpA family protein [Candidatus Omnitrophota bacterium]MBU2528477.1 OmpA family protein [bacterium]MBU3930815.1 OmpA family protein [bacterium]MBU4122400.1 OmpA family protein [bacterium]